MTKRVLLCFLSSLIMASIAPFLPARAQALSDHLIITEIKLGGGNDPKEYVELYNDTGAEVDLANFTLEYAKPGYNADYCNSISWKTNASPSTLVNTKILSGNLAAGALVVVELSMNDGAAGSVHIVEPGRMTIHDRVGWGSSPPCYWGTPAAQPANGQSLKRTFNEAGAPNVNVPENNMASFTVTDQPSPGSDPCLETDCYAPPPPDPEPDPDPVTDYFVRITELLPNPGSPKLDSDDEYIELYNPYNFAIDLTGYTLYAASPNTTNTYSLAGVTLQPLEYKAFHSALTGLSLVNSAGGRVWLMSPNSVKVSETQPYTTSMGDNIAWALIGGTWQKTDRPTESTPNQASAVTNDTASKPETTTKACPAGKYRNPATNRCRSLRQTPALTACRSGQRRNPTTNRCRAIAVTAKPKACASGQERNPETNRCRKVTGVKGTLTREPASGVGSGKINYWLVGGVAALVAGYAIYEYRSDLKSLYGRLKGRLLRVKK